MERVAAKVTSEISIVSALRPTIQTGTWQTAADVLGLVADINLSSDLAWVQLATNADECRCTMHLSWTMQSY